MIDRIRQDIQERLDQLLTEADRLRQALSALGGERAGQAGRRSGSRQPSAGSRSRKQSAAGTARSRSTAGTRRRATSASSSGRGSARSTSSRGGRAASGGTKNAVLKALTDASGKAMTASEVASATGLGRASVSTTLSKLARSGEVNKADRGYRLSGSGSPSSAGSGASQGAGQG